MGSEQVTSTLPRQIARFAQHVVHPVPVYGQEHNVRVLRRLARRSGTGAIPGFAREALELPPAVRIAENHLVPRAGEDCSQLSAHQTGSQDSDAHLTSVKDIDFAADPIVMNSLVRFACTSVGAGNQRTRRASSCSC